jgi:hypothetical protein
MILTLEKPLSSVKTTGEVLRLPCKFIKGDTTLDSMAVTALSKINTRQLSMLRF